MTPRAVLTEALAAVYSGANETDADALLDQLADMGHTVVRFCAHDSSDGIDQTPLDDPAKVWRCHECGALYQSCPDSDAVLSRGTGQPPVAGLNRDGGTSQRGTLAGAAATAGEVESVPSSDSLPGAFAAALCPRCGGLLAVSLDPLPGTLADWRRRGLVVTHESVVNLPLCEHLGVPA